MPTHTHLHARTRAHVHAHARALRQIAADRAYAALVAALKVDFDDAELVGVSSLTHTPVGSPQRECRAKP
jgi:hypothetical protein